MTTAQALEFILKKNSKAILDEPYKLRNLLRQLAPDQPYHNEALLLCLKLGLHKRLFSHPLATTTELAELGFDAKRMDKSFIPGTLQLLAEQLATSAEEKPASDKPKVAEDNNDTEAEVQTLVSGYVGEFVLVEGGEFMMGATPEMGNAWSEIEKPAHPVKVNSFFMGKTPVTQAQWEAIMGNNPSRAEKNANFPVEMVSWNQVQLFIEKLNLLEATNKYRLPTEAEWEYAARGGKKSKKTKFAGSDNIENVAWYSGNGHATKPVMQKKPNELGLYDMSGLVWEWCADIFGPYPEQYQDNPNVQSGGTDHVVRGGSRFSHFRNCRVSAREHFPASDCYDNLGFRLVSDL